MLLTLLPILAPVFIATAVGFIWARSGAEYPSDFIGRLVMTVGTPCLIVSSMASTDVELASITRVALAAALVLGLTGVLAYGVLRVKGFDVATYLPPIVLPNNGNMGLPVCLFAFGEQGLALALGYFLVMMFITFTMGLAVVAGGHGPRAMARAVLSQPVLWAMLLALALLFSDTPVPLWLANTLDLLGGFAIPLMMITLGVSLGRLKVKKLKYSVIFSAMRIGGGLAIAYAVVTALGLTGVERGVVLLQSAMPVAVFTYILSLRYERDYQEVAAMVVTSTAMAFITLPVILAWVLPSVAA
ncbi:AEC family transporter [Gilvimarinus agarilyticus]|uniref:AEC family transporter n=1 Tax=Gilvimarinus agarilyticus TaxID=679259 RepID=UPI00059F5F8C|nr:AEC family transporter [Gilvimarinus agarilyticus]